FFVGLLQGVLQMRNVIGLLIVIPLISWVLQEEPYIEDIISLFHKLINSSRKFYFTLMSLTQVLTYFLLFGSITMMYQFVDMFLREQKGVLMLRVVMLVVLCVYAFFIVGVVSSHFFIFASDSIVLSFYIRCTQGFLVRFVVSWMALTVTPKIPPLNPAVVS